MPELHVLLHRLTEAPHARSGETVLLHLVRYPALLAMYAAGVAMSARQNYSGLGAVLAFEVRNDNERRPLLTTLSPHNVVTDGIAQELRGTRRSPTALSDELHEALRKPFGDLIPSDNEYAEVFDRFEYLLSLAEADWWLTSGKPPQFSGGRFQRHWPDSPESLPRIFDAELARDGAAWSPLAAGMFGGDMARLQAAKAAVDEWALKGNW